MCLFGDGHGASLGHQWTGIQSKRMVKLSHGHQKKKRWRGYERELLTVRLFLLEFYEFISYCIFSR
jgi:hypothetical protein